MRLLVVNPNDSQAMTAAIEASCRAVVAADTALVVRSAEGGVASVEGYYDGALATVAVLRTVGQAGDADGIVIACFDDTGLHAARELAGGPVVGIGEAAMHAAALVGSGFSILTAQAKSIRILEANAAAYGLATACRGVHALERPVLALEDAAVFEPLLARAQAVLAHDGTDTLVLGCAGMTPYRAALEARLGCPVIDGVPVAVKLVEALVGLGLRTSKRGAYGPGVL